MKQIICGMLCAFVACASALYSIAATETVDGITWTYTVVNGKATLGGSSSIWAVPTSTTGTLTIPSILGGYLVTSIGSSAFSGCSGLTSVTIPNSVTSIGSYAFDGCSGLTSVTIPDSVTNIGYPAFYNCTNVTDVVVPGWKCEIPFGAVTNLVISDGTTSIRPSAFCYCSGLTSVTIPNSVTSIGSYAFDDCSGLTNVTIPGGVTNIGYGAFINCNGLMSISVADDNLNYKSINGLLLSKDGTTLIQGINKDVVIPDSVTDIGDQAFYDCSGLTSVTIPDSVTSIGGRAFSRCSGLTSVTIPDSVTTIGYEAFSGCSGLTSVTIPDSVTSLPSSAFEGCGRLWTAWYRTLANSSSGSSGGGSPSVVTTVVQQVESPYALTDYAADRAIASVTVDGDCGIDEFVLKDGEVYDSVLYVNNTAERAVTLTLPSGYSYKTYKGTKPLVIPAKSQCILSITRVADRTFLVSREELEDVQ